MSQLAIPVDIRPEEISRKKTLGHAIELCAELAGFELDKQLQEQIGVDKGQFSRWLSGQEGIKWEKLSILMDACGNDAPILWMLHQRGYDLSRLHKRESEVEKALRNEHELRIEAEKENELLRKLLTGKVA